MDVLRDMSQTALVRAVEANLTEFHVFLSGWPEVTLHQDEDRAALVVKEEHSLQDALIMR